MELNYQAIINALQYQANVLIKDSNKYGDLVCYFVNEQAFDKRKLASNEMLVVVRFGAASVLQGKLDVAIYFDIIGLPNEIEKTQEFFTDYALMFNESDSNGILQYYNTPSVANRFNDYGYETRTTLSMQGALVISLTEGIVDIAVFNKDTNEYESVRFLGEELDTNFTPLPEATGDSNGENRTTNQAKTITFAFSTYITNNYFVRKVIRLALDKNANFNESINIKVNIIDIYEFDRDFVVQSCKLKREVATTPVLSIVLAV